MAQLVLTKIHEAKTTIARIAESMSTCTIAALMRRENRDDNMEKAMCALQLKSYRL